jgi:lipid A oxidase
MSWRPRAHRTVASVLAAGLVLAAAPSAWGEVELTLFAGDAEIPDSELRLTLPDGTDLRFEDVSWDDASFEEPPYYGLRATWWLRRSPGWGLSLDFTHAKAILDVDEVVPIRGRRAGRPVSETLPVGEELPSFQMSHGLNTLTLGGLRRWGLAGAERSGVTYFAGVGAGVTIPHVEARVNGLQTAEYQVAGPALQAVLGLDTAVDQHFGIALEARVGWVDVAADLTGGGRIETDLFLFQLAAGLRIRD